MADKYLLFSLDDEKAKNLGDVISSSTARKIVNFLAEQEASETEISKSLGLALNTAEYNLKKLLEAGIIEKSKKFFWSKKGKKINIYKVANKLIVIAPKKSRVYSKLKSVVPVVLISAILTAFIAWYSRTRVFMQKAAEKTVEKAGEEIATTTTAGEVAEKLTETVLVYQPIWLWFLIGSLVAIIAFLIWNWKRL